jgi:hypothetical protein
VDEEQVELLQLQLLHARLEGGPGGAGAAVLVGQLGGDEDVLVREPAGAWCAAHAGVVLVPGGGVDVAVAGVQGGEHHLVGLLLRHLPDAEADLRDGVAVR